MKLTNVTFGQNNIHHLGYREDLRLRSSEKFVMRNSVAQTMKIIGGEVDIAYSLIPDFPGPGNIDTDPQWVDPENGDYRLKLSSPCIDSGTITDATMDLNGNPRPVDVVGIGKDGPGAYDMGAFEFQLSPADLTRNGTVDGEDLIEFQTQWMREGD